MGFRKPKHGMSAFLERSAPLGELWAFALGLVAAAAACGSSSLAPTSDGSDGDAAATAGDGADGAATGQNQQPVAKIKFQLTPPRDDADYPYSADAPPPDGPLPNSTVYLSAADSFDPGGAPVTYFWNVQDSRGAYLALDPSTDAARVSFSTSRIGKYTITLEVVGTGPLHQIGQTTIVLLAGPHPCAPDGVSPPCSDAGAVPGGTFTAGTDPGIGSDSEHPAHAATVAPFALDVYEVTVGRFRRFLASFTGDPPPDGAGAHPLIPGSGWQSAWNIQLPTSSARFDTAIASCGGPWTPRAGANEARPISCVSWYEAFAFCLSEGKRLPTEAEWEYAAAGGDEQRRYPWGDEEPTPDLVVYNCLFDGDPSCDDADLPVVGSLAKGAGRWGQLDLAGSLWEWVLDAYTPYTSDPCVNCAAINEPPDGGRVFRGGDSRLADPSWLTVTTRLGIVAALPDDRRGFRCAISTP